MTNEYHACLQAIARLNQDVTKTKAEETVQALLTHVRNLLKEEDFDGRMSIVFDNSRIKWSDLIRQKNVHCASDETSKQCQLARRLIMFAIRGARVDNDDIIVPGRIGKQNIVSTRVPGVGTMDGLCADNIPLDPSFDFAKPLNKATSLRFAWDEGHEHAFQPGAMPKMRFDAREEGFDRVEADARAKQEWNSARQDLMRVLDSITNEGSVTMDDLQQRETEIMGIFKKLSSLFDLPLTEEWEQTAASGVKAELGKLLNRCVSVSTIINLANVVQIAFLLIFNKLRELASEETMREEMRVRRGKTKSSGAGQDSLAMPVSSRKEIVERQRVLQKLQSLDLKASSAREEANDEDQTSPNDEGRESSDRTKRKKKKKKKKKTGRETSDDDDDIRDAIVQNLLDLHARFEARMRSGGFDDLNDEETKLIIFILQEDDSNFRDKVIHFLSSLCPHNRSTCTKLIVPLVRMIRYRNFIPEKYDLKNLETGKRDDRLVELLWTIMLDDKNMYVTGLNELLQDDSEPALLFELLEQLARKHPLNRFKLGLDKDVLELIFRFFRDKKLYLARMYDIVFDGGVEDPIEIEKESLEHWHVYKVERQRAIMLLCLLSEAELKQAYIAMQYATLAAEGWRDMAQMHKEAEDRWKKKQITQQQITQSNKTTAEFIFRAAALPPIFKLLRDDDSISDEEKALLIRTLGNLSLWESIPVIRAMGGIQILVNNLREGGGQVSEEAVRALGLIVEVLSAGDIPTDLIRSGLLPAIVEFMHRHEPTDEYQETCLKILRDCVIDDRDYVLDAVVEAGVIHVLHRIIRNPPSPESLSMASDLIMEISAVPKHKIDPLALAAVEELVARRPAGPGAAAAEEEVETLIGLE